jgi:tetratricopeptide (TPR) repeat protein
MRAVEMRDDFVGRERELHQLRAALDGVLAGRAGVVLIAGDPGVGKTTLARIVAAEAAERGARTVWGRCWEAGGAPPYWPWTQALRSLVAERQPKQVEELGRSGYLAQLVPELAGSEPPVLEGEHARFGVFDTAARLLGYAAADSPLVLVLDDLHAADVESLLLLQFVARELRDSPLLVLGIYRELEARAHEVAAPLASVAREALQIRIAGLERDELAKMVERRTGETPAGTVLDGLLQATQGNPFFVGELVRLLGPTVGLDRRPGAALEIPDTVRETIARRLEYVSEPTRAVLEMAAALGVEFGLEPLTAVAGAETAELVEMLDEAARGGVVVERGAGQFAFSHGLFREVLYTDLPRSRRVALHRAAAEALERMTDGGAPAPLSELAHHWFQVAAGGGDREHAIERGIEAAREDARRHAYEHAIHHFKQVLELTEPARETELVGDVYLELGEAQWRAAETSAAKESFERAHALARELGSATRLASAALGFGGRFAWVEATGNIDKSLLSMIEDALEAIEASDEDHDALCVRLLARLAMQLYFSETRFEEAHSIAAQGVELARALGDQGTLAYALNARRFVMWGQPPDDERLRISEETLRAAEAAGDTELVLRGHGWRIVDFLERGDLRRADREAKLHAERAEELRQPLYLSEAAKFKAMRALMAGRLDDAERLMFEFASIAERTPDPDIAQAVGIQLFMLRGLQGRAAELEPAVRAMVESYPDLPAWRCGLAFLLTEADQLDEAAAVLDDLAQDDFAWRQNQSGGWMIGVAVLAEVCARLGDARRAQLLYDVMLPFEGTNCVVGYAAGCFGAMDRALAVLAVTASRVADAKRHVLAAIELNKRMGARPWLAWSELDHGALLLVGGGAREEAEEHLRSAAELAAGCGALRLERRATDILARVDELDGAPVSAVWGACAAEAVRAASYTPAPREQMLFMREGEFWSIGRASAPIRLRDTKGLRHLAQLLATPEHEFHVLELAVNGPVVDEPEAGSASLDRRATAEYRARIADLREEIEEAEQFADPERASRAREELDFIAAELSRSVGLGGRERKTGSSAERARVNVTRAIRTTIKRIEAEDTSLARHLDASIRTGAFCSYVPEPRSAPEWVLNVG